MERRLTREQFESELLAIIDSMPTTSAELELLRLDDGPQRVAHSNEWTAAGIALGILDTEYMPTPAALVEAAALCERWGVVAD